MLLILFELRANKTWMVSIRSAAFFWLFGTSVINIFLGLFSIWLILYLGIAGYFHITLFFESLRASNDIQRDEGGNGDFIRVNTDREAVRARLERF